MTQDFTHYIQYAIDLAKTEPKELPKGPSITPEHIPYKEPGLKNTGAGLTGPQQSIGSESQTKTSKVSSPYLVGGPYAGPYAPPTVPPGSTTKVPLRNPATFMPKEGPMDPSKPAQAEDVVASYVNDLEPTEKATAKRTAQEAFQGDQYIGPLAGIAARTAVAAGASALRNSAPPGDNFVLKAGKSPETKSENISELMGSYKRTGDIGTSEPASKEKAQKQAVAIAMDKARESNNAATPPGEDFDGLSPRGDAQGGGTMSPAQPPTPGETQAFAEWAEAQHPRGKAGVFAPKGGGAREPAKRGVKLETGEGIKEEKARIDAASKQAQQLESEAEQKKKQIKESMGKSRTAKKKSLKGLGGFMKKIDDFLGIIGEIGADIGDALGGGGRFAADSTSRVDEMISNGIAVDVSDPKTGKRLEEFRAEMFDAEDQPRDAEGKWTTGGHVTTPKGEKIQKVSLKKQDGQKARLSKVESQIGTIDRLMADIKAGGEKASAAVAEWKRMKAEGKT